MGIKRWHIERDAIHNEHIKDGEIEYGKLKSDTIQIEIAIPLGYIPYNQSAVTTGVKYESKQYVFSSELLKHVKTAYFESNLQQLTSGAAVAIELYDYTAASVITSLSLSATSKRSRSADIKANLTAGNSVGARLNVTTGVTGGVAGGCSPVLILVLGVS